MGWGVEHLVLKPCALSTAKVIRRRRPTALSDKAKTVREVLRLTPSWTAGPRILRYVLQRVVAESDQHQKLLAKLAGIIRFRLVLGMGLRGGEGQSWG